MNLRLPFGWSDRLRGEALIVLASRMANAACGLVLVLVTARSLGPSGRGEVALVFTIAWGTTFVSDLGTHTSGRLRLLRGDGTIGSRNVLSLTLALLPLQVAVSSVLVLVVSVASVQMSLPFGVSAVFLSVSTMAFNSMMFLLYGLRRYSTVFLVECVIAVVGIVGILMLHLTGQLSPTSVVLLMAAAPAVGALWLARRSWALGAERGSADRPWRELVVDGISPMLGAVALFVALRADRILLALMAGARSVGLFTVALAVPETLRILPKAFAQVIADRGRGGVDTVEAVRRSVRLFTVCHWMVLSVAMLAGHWLLPRVFGDGFSEARDVLVLVTVAEAILVVHLMHQAVLVAFARPARIGVPQVIGASTVGILDLVLIPVWGLQGAAWACIIGYGVLAVTSVRWVDHELRAVAR